MWRLHIPSAGLIARGYSIRSLTKTLCWVLAESESTGCPLPIVTRRNRNGRWYRFSIRRWERA